MVILDSISRIAQHTLIRIKIIWDSSWRGPLRWICLIFSTHYLQMTRILMILLRGSESCRAWILMLILFWCMWLNNASMSRNFWLRSSCRPFNNGNVNYKNNFQFLLCSKIWNAWRKIDWCYSAVPNNHNRYGYLFHLIFRLGMLLLG